MAFELHQDKHTLPIQTLVDLNPRTPVKLAGTSGLLVTAAASANDEVFGFTNAATYLAGEIAAVYFSQNIVKARAGASVGAGAGLIVGSSNGVVIPGGVAASGHFLAGQSMSAAAAGEIVSVFVNPRKA